MASVRSRLAPSLSSARRRSARTTSPHSSGCGPCLAAPVPLRGHLALGLPLPPPAGAPFAATLVAVAPVVAAAAVAAVVIASLPVAATVLEAAVVSEALAASAASAAEVEVALAAVAVPVAALAAAPAATAAVAAALEAHLPVPVVQAAAFYLHAAAIATVCAWATLFACRLTSPAWRSLRMSTRTRTWCERTSSVSTRSAASPAAPTRTFFAPSLRTTPSDSASATARPTSPSLPLPLPARLSFATRRMLPRLRASRAHLRPPGCRIAAAALMRRGARAPRSASLHLGPSPSRAQRAMSCLRRPSPPCRRLRPTTAVASGPSRPLLLLLLLPLPLQPRLLPTSAVRLCV